MNSRHCNTTWFLSSSIKTLSSHEHVLGLQLKYKVIKTNKQKLNNKKISGDVDVIEFHFKTYFLKI